MNVAKASPAERERSGRGALGMGRGASTPQAALRADLSRQRQRLLAT
jgi:hypothetical protein